MRAMKDSGIPWIGEIPEGWNVCRVKDVALLYNGNSIKDEEKENYTNDTNAYPYISTKDIDAVYQTIDYTNGLYTKVDDSYFKIAHSGCSLMCIEGGSAGKKKAFVERSVSFVNKLCCFSPYRIEGKFLFHYLCSPNFEMEFNKYVTGLIGGVSVSTLKNFIALVPPLAEQQRIAEFLDRKCAEVDEMIALQEQIIEEFKAYKQSVITEAVTKGLNPDVPMKDSGIEWIGQIPEHWEIAKLSILFSFKGGYAFDSSDFRLDGTNQVVRIGNVKNDSLLLDASPVYISNEIAFKAQKFKLEKGQILFTMTGTKGKRDYFYTLLLKDNHFSDKELYLNQRVGCFIGKDRVYTEYYNYLLKDKHILDAIFLYETGTANQGNLGIESIKQTKVQFPPLAEQQAIADYLGEKCGEIDKLIATKQQKIDSLKEYKKSIIYEYVTGKKEIA